MNRSAGRLLLALALAWLPACAGPERAVESAASPTLVAEAPEPLASPAGPGAMAPYLAAAGEDLLMSWLEPGHRFLVSRLHDGSWSEPVVVAQGDDFFANWADVPKVAVAGDGTLWAHWLAKLGAGTYAYGIFLARSADGGASWQPMGLLHHDDRSPTEHGFVAYAPEGDGLRAVWLDGREMEQGGPMTVRSARLDETVGASQVIDPRVCECCPTALAATARGALAIYRDRSSEEVRNMGVSRFDGGDWSAPRALHDDGWKIPGCPVNGPAVDAAGETVAVAWFTVIDQAPRVQLAFSHDSGDSFGPPRVVDGDRPLGRVSLVLDGDASAWVSWLAVRDDRAEVMVGRFAAEGESRERWSVASTGGSRGSGIPRLARVGDRLYIAWVETADDQPAAVRMATWTAPGG